MTPSPASPRETTGPYGGKRVVEEDWSFFNDAARGRAGLHRPPPPDRLADAEAYRRRMIGLGVLIVLVAAAIYLLVIAWKRNQAVDLSLAGMEMPALRIHPDDLARLSAAPSGSGAQRAAAQAESTARGEGAAAPVVNYTVFQSVTFAHGRVVSGWKFGSSEAQAPSDQYCYFEAPGPASVRQSVSLASQPGGQRLYNDMAALGLSATEWQDAMKQCRWFAGRATGS